MKPLSDHLAQLSVQAKSTEERIAPAQSEAHERIEQRREQLRLETQQALDSVNQKVSQAKEDAQGRARTLKAKIDADFANLKEQAREDRAEFKAWQAGDAGDLPVLTGVKLEDLAKDRPGSVARLATGLTVLEHYERLPVSRVQRAQEVNLAPDGAVVLVVGTRGVSLHLGQGPWPKKLLMVAEVLRQFERQKELPGVVFLDNELHPERVVVRMR